MTVCELPSIDIREWYVVMVSPLEADAGRAVGRASVEQLGREAVHLRLLQHGGAVHVV